MLISIGWLIHWSICLQSHRHMGWKGPLEVSSPTSHAKQGYCQQLVRPAQPLSRQVLKTSGSGVSIPSSVTGLRAASLSFLSCNLGTSSANFYYCPLIYLLPLPRRVGSVIYCSSSSSLNLGTLHPWRYSKLEQTALNLTQLQAGVRVGISRRLFQPKLFCDFAVMLVSNSRFLLQGHQSKVTY